MKTYASKTVEFCKNKRGTYSCSSSLIEYNREDGASFVDIDECTACGRPFMWECLDAVEIE